MRAHRPALGRPRASGLTSPRRGAQEAAMDFEPAYTAEQEEFRSEVRAWLGQHVPDVPHLERDTPENYQRFRQLHRELGARGWLWPTAPVEYGGGGLSVDHMIVVAEELDRYDLPLPPIYDSGGRLGGASVLIWGTEEQKARMMPRIIKGEVVTWQLLTGPEAGSDLAGTTTDAVRDGDEYVINGEKLYIGGSHDVDYLWTIVRTDRDGERHKNLSWFMIPADLPGITIKPMELLGDGAEGVGHSWKNTIYFEDVRVSADDLVGGENNGWQVATTHLELEHGSGGRIGRNRWFEEALQLSLTMKREGKPLIEHDDVRSRMVDLFVRTEVNRLFELRNFWMNRTGTKMTYEGPQSSYFRKIGGLEISQAIMDMVGPYALTNDPEFDPEPWSAGVLHAARYPGAPPRRHHRYPEGDHGAPYRHRARPGGASGGDTPVAPPRRHPGIANVEDDAMDLSLNELQQMLKHSVDDFLARSATRDAILEAETSAAGYSPEMWKIAAEIGWLGMVTPEQYGGTGGSLTDAAVVFEGLGRGPVPGPFFSSGVLSPLIITEAGNEEQRQRYLPSLASGQTVCALAMTEPEWGWGADSVQMQAKPSADGGYVVSGVKVFAFDALAADHLIVPARADGQLVLLMVDTSNVGVEVRRMTGFLTSECVVRLTDVKVPAGDVLEGGQLALERAFLRATPILCAQMVGGAQAVYEMSVEYSRRRRQFSQPIGRFQHVQNHIVQLVNYVDGARWTTFEALWKLDEARPNAEISVHLAKVCASEGYVQATNYAHEVHAGIGVMREYGLTQYTRASRSLYHALGDPQWHRRRLGKLLPQTADEAIPA
ncbi:MAG: hypothetical protein GEU80_06135 [Dehalococcoidia bacterium]|nr:hypothetical protein [Dehalococcoidia bacterium]